MKRKQLFHNLNYASFSFQLRVTLDSKGINRKHRTETLSRLQFVATVFKLREYWHDRVSSTNPGYPLSHTCQWGRIWRIMGFVFRAICEYSTYETIRKGLKAATLNGEDAKKTWGKSIRLSWKTLGYRPEILVKCFNLERHSCCVASKETSSH